MYWTFINFIVPSNPWIAQHYQFHHCLFCTVVLCHRVELNLEMGHWIRTQFIVPIVFLSELFVIVEIIKSVVFFVWTRSSFWIWKNCFSANVVMSTAVVPSRVGNPFPQKKKTMKLFHHLLSDMKHQRVAVIALALGQAVNIYDYYCERKANNFSYRFFPQFTHLTLCVGIGALCIVFGVSWADSCQTNITTADCRSLGSERTRGILWNTEDTWRIDQRYSIHGGW